jgi:membrane-associated phospholipid phosphatase
MAVAAALAGWKRVTVAVIGIMFIAAIAISRVYLEAHTFLEVVVGSMIGLVALAAYGSSFWMHRPIAAPLRALLVTSAILMAVFNGHDVRAEDLLHAIGIYLNRSGITCF